MKGSKVKEKLVSSGFKIVDIAKKMGVLPQTLQNFLRTDDIKVGVLERIAKAAGKDIIFFLGDNDIVRIPKVNDQDPELARMIQSIRATINYLEIFKK